MIQPFQKCLEFDSDLLDRWIATGNCTVEEKYDGVRCRLTADGAFFRSGKRCESVQHLLDIVQLQGDEYIEGELLVEGKKFAEAAGIVRRKETQPEIVIRVFTVTFDRNIADILTIPTSIFKCIQEVEVDTREQADKIYQEHVDRGCEGVVYKCNGEWMKRKPVPTVDIYCTDVVEGTGKYVGMMGAIYVDFNGVEVKVGTGFNDAQRKQFWNNPDDIVGQLVEIKYMNVTESGSLRQPVFIGIRDDKVCKE